MIRGNITHGCFLKEILPTMENGQENENSSGSRGYGLVSTLAQLKSPYVGVYIGARHIWQSLCM